MRLIKYGSGPASCLYLYYNFVRIHQTLKTTRAMAAGVTKRLWEIKDVVEMLEAWEAAQTRFESSR